VIKTFYDYSTIGSVLAVSIKYNKGTTNLQMMSMTMIMMTMRICVSALA